VGKRSRKRGGLEVAHRPLPPRDDPAPPATANVSTAKPGRGAPDTARYDVQPATTFMGRVAESWRMAGERPSKAVPRSERVAARPQRPEGMFGGLPVSEILMLVGFVGLIVGLVRGPDDGATAMSAGVAVIALGTFELTAREHFSGYRSHAFFLALIITVAMHAAVALGVGDGAGKSPLLIVADVVVFLGLGWTFGARYKRARRDLRGGAR